MAWRIPETDIERVKRSTDLRALVQSRGIELKKHGSKDWIGRCPFHADKDSPNFIVTPDKGLFHCMACGLAGNAIQFVERHDGVSFRHAFELLNQGGTAALTLTQVAALLAVPNITDPLGVRDRAMLELFYSCGLRRAELCRLELTDLNPERRTLTIRRGKGNKDRVVPVGARAVTWLERYLKEVRPRLSLDTRTPAFFLTGYGDAFNPDVLSRMTAAWMKVAGLKGSCHLLRHTCATHMLEGGADIRYIQQLLGHEKLETTAIYTEVTIKGSKGVIKGSVLDIDT